MTDTLYSRLGEEAGLRALVDRFYDLMDTLPQAAPIRRMHPADLTSSRTKLFEFLSGWTGGPSLYIAKHGHPRLRARHMPFAIDASARDQWMLCMAQAIEETVEGELLQLQLTSSFARIADHMRNQG